MWRLCTPTTHLDGRDKHAPGDDVLNAPLTFRSTLPCILLTTCTTTKGPLPLIPRFLDHHLLASVVESDRDLAVLRDRPDASLECFKEMR